MEGVAASDPWEDQADAGTTRPAGGTAQSGDDPLGQVEAAFPDPWGPDTTAVGSQSVGSNVPDPARGGADEFDYNDALKTLDGKDGIVRSAIPTEYEEALRHLDRQERMEVERRATESARETDDYARQLRDDIAAETARERRAEAQRERERRDAGNSRERAMRLEQERQGEEREQRSKALLERNLQIQAAFAANARFNLVACDSATPPRDGLRWNPNRGHFSRSRGCCEAGMAGKNGAVPKRLQRSRPWGVSKCHRDLDVDQSMTSLLTPPPVRYAPLWLLRSPSRGSFVR